MAITITLDFQYQQTVWGRANLELDVEKIRRDYGSLESLEEEDWRNIIADAESYVPKGGDSLVEYCESNVESEEFSDFYWGEPSDSIAPDTIDEARGV